MSKVKIFSFCFDFKDEIMLFLHLVSEFISIISYCFSRVEMDEDYEMIHKKMLSCVYRTHVNMLFLLMQTVFIKKKTVPPRDTVENF